MEDEVKKRLTTVETSVGDIKVQVAGIAAVMPHLATREDMRAMDSRISGIAAVIPHLATKEDVQAIHLAAKEDVQTVHLATREDMRVMDSKISSVVAVLPHLATKGDIHDLNAKNTRWIVGALIACGLLALAVARLFFNQS